MAFLRITGTEAHWFQNWPRPSSSKGVFRAMPLKPAGYHIYICFVVKDLHEEIPGISVAGLLLKMSLR